MINLKKKEMIKGTAEHIFYLLENIELNDEGNIVRLPKTYYEQKERVLKKDKVKLCEIKEIVELNKRSIYTNLTEALYRKNNTRMGLYYDITSKIVYVKFDNFDTELISEVIEIIKRGLDKGKKKLVIDLKNNCGGNVENCARLLDLFIESDSLFELYYSNKQVKYVASSCEKTSYSEIEILTSEYTMSSAEIFTDAMSKASNVFVPNRDRFNKKTGQSVYYFKSEKIAFKVNSFYWEV
ncbi:S41 family peptidase [Anaerococcus vaginalis]|uniref:S41 family peptidase n=1 Tax=Anaerococcus vaginalis TaxID=33037 RepID=UPI002430A813|nr:S41 family peptidase [Anaerococcus vaginalis]MDU5925202.1 S41 family peptidase [Finegoldia magna]